MARCSQSPIWSRTARTDHEALIEPHLPAAGVSIRRVYRSYLDSYDIVVLGSGQSRKFLAWAIAVAGPCIADGFSTI